jgi:hypothetical protein
MYTLLKDARIHHCGGLLAKKKHTQQKWQGIFLIFAQQAATTV